MNLSELSYELPTELIAKTPKRPSRILFSENGVSEEIGKENLFAKFSEGDVLVINNTAVLKRRIFYRDLEILFLGISVRHQSPMIWEVLFPAKNFAVNSWIDLPDGLQMRLLEKGRPQIVELSRAVDEVYFDQHAQLPLPPYIQELRESRQNLAEDNIWYQTAWAKLQGSLAAPTASLHFTQNDLSVLREKGVSVLEITLHVGLGTFLPIKVDNLDQHEMHSEEVCIPDSVWTEVLNAKSQERKIFVLGTTVMRTLESFYLFQKGLIPEKNGFSFEKSTTLEGSEVYYGKTSLFIRPGFEFHVADYLLTNFHQPQSSLLALVYAFYGKSSVQSAYHYAINHRFRFLSYGDLSVWCKQAKE